MISGNIKNNLQKEIPIFTAMIRDLYEKLDKKFHLNGASVPVTFGYDIEKLGSYTRQSAHEKEHFYFSLPHGFVQARICTLHAVQYGNP